jgi:hypothetical protein
MALLKALPTVNLQLWAQLAQAAGAKGFWPLARNCAEAAAGALPASAGSVAAAVAAPQQVAGWSRQDWFWLGVAEWQHGLVSGQQTHAAVPASLGCMWTPFPLQHLALIIHVNGPCRSRWVVKHAMHAFPSMY